MDFIDQIIETAKRDVKTIVLPESGDPRTIKAAAILSQNAIADVILLGNRDEILKNAAGDDLSRVRIVDPAESGGFAEYADSYYELRKAKGVTKEQAVSTMKNPLFYGTMMVKKGEADGMVAGAVNSTANTLRPALQIIKTAPGTKIVSSFFVMVVPDKQYGCDGKFVFADCGLVENPAADCLSEIAISAAKSFEALIREEPFVAMLSYSTYGSANSGLTQKVVEAARLTREKAPNLRVDGELQVDAAIVPSVGKSKAPASKVAGRANVLIFPDLNSGNIAYKLIQRLAKAEAYGPITQGLAKPVNDLSRGCSAEDIVGVAAITCVQAQSAAK